MVRLYRTFSICIFIGDTRCACCLCTSSGWFKHTEPLRTFSNYILTEIARYIEFFYMSSGWFDCTEPSPTTSLQGCNMHRFGEVQTQRTSSNLLKLHPHRDNKVYKFLLYEFGVVRLYRTFSIYIVIVVQVAYALVVQAHRTSSNLLELHPDRDSKVYKFIIYEFGVVRLYRTFSIYIVIGETRLLMH